MTTLHKLLVLLMLSILGLFTSCSNDNDPNLPSINYTNAEDLFNEVGFQGYAIVTKNGNDILRKGFGLANKNTSLPQDYNLMYRLGSVSKTLTAAAIVQLKRDGFIYSFHQTLYEFDAAFPNGNQITIAQLLAHQSGIPEYQIVVENAFENGEILNETDIYNLITDLISENGLNFTPGSNKQYCNSNYFIAAMLVEQLTGIPYHQYIQQHIFTPLTMSNSFKGATEINVNTHAQGYFNGAVNSTYPMTIPFGAGDFSSTPKDMETWVNAVKSDWFTATEKNEIFADNIPSGFVDFGLGWFTTQEGDTTMYWHGGDINGYWSMIGFIPAFDACIVLLSNQQDNTGAQRQTIIQQLLTNEFN